MMLRLLARPSESILNAYQATISIVDYPIIRLYDSYVGRIALNMTVRFANELTDPIMVYIEK